MLTLHHLNCGTLRPPFPPGALAYCHCLLLEENGRMAIVDAGIGLQDCRRPQERLGQTLIDLAGFQLDESASAVRLIEAMGRDPRRVTDILLTHADPDHTGGLADFPWANVHLAAEEHANLQSGNPRYVSAHFAHAPRLITHSKQGGTRDWFGLEARPLPLDFSTEVLLVPLPGHTLGHCAIAIQDRPGHWLLHAGDAYYLRAELDPGTPAAHPIFTLVAARADDNEARLRSVNHLKRLLTHHGDEIDLSGYHDPEEYLARTAT